VFNITDPDSFSGAKRWVKDLQTHAEAGVIIAREIEVEGLAIGSTMVLNASQHGFRSCFC